MKLNSETNTIIREGIENTINPFDTYAIEEAIRLKEKFGGKVTAITMGIPKAAELLQYAIAMGADDAILLSDRKFAGADSLATAYTLAKAVYKISDYRLIICGKQASDGDTAQVGPSLAEKLSVPHTTYVNEIKEVDSTVIRCKKLLDEGHEVVELALPALITVVKEINTPRLPSIAGFRKARQAKIPVWTASDIEASEDSIGLKGSPTQVKKTFAPVHHADTQFIAGTPWEQAQELARRLLNMGV